MADDKLPAAIREAEEALALGHTDCIVCCHAVEQEALAERKRLRGLSAPRRLTGYSDVHCDDCKAVVRLEVALRSLLAASAPAAREREEKGPRCPFCDTARIERDARLDLWVCHVCKRSWAVVEEPAPPSRPAQDAVREAAERLRASLVAVPSWEALLPKNCGACEGESDCAGEHEPCGCHETLAVIEASLALLAALIDARGGAS